MAAFVRTSLCYASAIDEHRRHLMIAVAAQECHVFRIDHDLDSMHSLLSYLATMLVSSIPSLCHNLDKLDA